MAISNFAQISPNGVSDKYLIDLMYMMQQSMYGLCLKLDNDGGVPLTTYVANCYTATFKGQVWDYRGNKTQNVTTVDYIVMPSGGLPNASLIEWIYDWVNSFETLTEQLDTDVLTDSTYEALGYHACILPYMIEGKTGTILGNDNAASGGITGVDTGGPPWRLTKIGPTGKPSDRILADFCYDMLNAWETMCEQLDADGTVTDVNYEALWYTATVLMKVENSQGNVLGNSETRLGSV